MLEFSEEYARKLADKGGRPTMIRGALSATLNEVNTLRRKRLREGREAAGLSVKTAAALLDLTMAHLGLMEAGTMPIPGELSDRAAKAFETSRTSHITPAGATAAECLAQVQAMLEPKGYEVTLADEEHTMFHMRGLRLRPIEIRGYGVYLKVAPYQAELTAGGLALAWRVMLGGRVGDFFVTTDDLRMGLVRCAMFGATKATRKAERKAALRLLIAATGFREDTINWDSWGGLDG